MKKEKRCNKKQPRNCRWTEHRWKGNQECRHGRWDIKTLKRKQSANEQIKEYHGKRDF